MVRRRAAEPTKDVFALSVDAPVTWSRRRCYPAGAVPSATEGARTAGSSCERVVAVAVGVAAVVVVAVVASQCREQYVGSTREARSGR